MKTKISVVVATRNDNYGGYLIYRFSNFLLQFKYIEKHYPNLFELVIIDWNSDNQKVQIEDLYNFEGIKNYKIKKYDNDYHNSVSDNSKIPFFEYIAKNEGIKYASSKYIITCTQDIIFSKKILDYLYYTELNTNSFYRVDRIDLNTDYKFKYNENFFINESLFNKYKSVYQSRQNFFFTILNSYSKKFFGRDLIFIKSKKMHKESFYQSSILMEYDKNLLRFKFFHKIYLFIYKELKDRKSSLIYYIVRLFSLCMFKLTNFSYIHNLCSGDFILTSKENFIRSGVFLKKIGPQVHLDSLACFQLFLNGINQIIISDDCVIYHQNHKMDDANIRNTYHKTDFLADLLSYIKKSY